MINASPYSTYPPQTGPIKITQEFGRWGVTPAGPCQYYEQLQLKHV